MASELLLFRSMQIANDGLPLVGPSSRTLGARPDIDIPVDADVVRPGTGGMSVSPNNPGNLPAHRRPPGLGGTGKDPAWHIGEVSLGSDLTYRPDPAKPHMHGYIEPAFAMSFDDYQRALAATRVAWQLSVTVSS